MADIKITDLAAYSDPTSTDVLPIVDVGSDITKKVTIADLLENAGAGTAAAPSFSFDGDNDTGIYKPAANQVGITAGGTQALLIESTGVTVPGNLTVQGTTTTIDTTTLVVEDKNVELGSVTTPTDTTANGGGITLKGASDKTINWVQSTGCWTFNQPTNFNDHVRINSSGNVGIGTTSPARLLHLQSSSGGGMFTIERTSATTSALVIAADSGQIKLFARDTNSGSTAVPLAFMRGGSDESMRIDSSGNVGIGTTSPDSLVHLRAASGNAVIRLENSNTSVASAESLGSIEWESNDASTGGTGVAAKLNVVDDNGFGTAYGMTFSTGLVSGGSMTLSERLRIDSSGQLILLGNGGSTTNSLDLNYNGTSGQAQINADSGGGNTFLTFGTSSSGSLSERLRIDSSGRVGIGTSSPSQLLDISSSGNAVTRINSGSSNTTGVILSRGGTEVARVSSAATDTLTFSTGSSATTRLTINSSGNVGIGTTSPTELLHIRKDASAVVAIKAQNNNSNGIMEYQAGNDADNWFFGIGSDDAFGISDVTGQAGRRLTITQTGNVGIGTTSPSALLHISKTVNSGDVALVIQNTGTSNNTASIRLNKGSGGEPDHRIQNDTGGNLTFARGTDESSYTEQMRIDSSGRLLVGTTSSQAHASANLVEIGNYTLTNAGITINSPTDGAGLINFGDSSSSNRRGRIEYTHVADAFRLYTADSERMRINSSGNVGIGTSSPGARLEVVGSDDANNLVVSSGNTDFAVYNDDTIGEVRLVAEDGSTNNNSKFLTLYTQASGASSSTERMRITSGGFVNIGNGGTDIIWNQTSTTGVGLGTVGVIQAARDGDQLMLLNRLTNDGTLVSFAQNGTLEGVITVSGGTVSYNGGHLARWSQLAGGAERTEILRGSVLSNLDEMCEWGEEDNEQLNRMKVSDAEGDVNVSGVFQAWDDDDDTYINDFYCAMTGDFVIRIAQGTTVARGDLLMSAGDGTAKPQDDDIVRSKTIAKVTSTTVSTTYADGSYCVPCVLMAC